MHVASMQRCALAVAESTGTASMQRRAPAAAETPKRWCPVAGDPILTRRRSHDETPRFPAVVKGSDDRIKHRVLCDPSEQPPAEDAVTGLTDQPPTKDTSEPSHGAIQHAFHAPSAHSIPPVTDHVLALDVDDDRQQTPLADIDSLGLHLPVDDAGPAYFVTHPTWNLPPWTCGPPSAIYPRCRRSLPPSPPESSKCRQPDQGLQARF